MKVSYKRELDHNYLVLEEEEYQENYQAGMLLKNRIPGFLECRMSRFDEGASFYYEITSRQSLRLVLERKRLNQEELLKLLNGRYRSVLWERYEIPEDREPAEQLYEIAKKRGCLKKGGEPDMGKAAAVLLEEFRSGRLGRITLELP